MGSVNRVILVGALGADPEVRTLGNGERVVNIRLATSEVWRDRQTNQKKERTEWHRVVIFNEALGKTAEAHLRKGSQVYIEGAIQTRKWADQAGQEKFSTEVVLQKFRGELVLLGSKPAADRDEESDSFDPGPRRQSTGPRETFSADLDDAIPF